MSFPRTAGSITAIAAGLAIIVGLVVAFLPPASDPSLYSYPSTPAVHVGFQLFSALQHAALAVGLLGLWRSGAAGAGALGRVAGVGAAASMVLLAVVDVIAAIAANEPLDAALPSALTMAYVVLTFAIGVLVILLGVAVIRAKAWTGWARAVVLVTGIWVFVPLTPALGLGFVPAQIALALWMVLFFGIGVALVRTRVAAPA